MTVTKPGPRTVYLPGPALLPLAESLVALANSDGGLIVLGVDRDGRPAGEVWEEEAELALREAAALCRPPVPTQFQAVELPGGRFIGISVPRSLELHSLADGRVLVRRRDENRPLTGEEIRTLAASGASAEEVANQIQKKARISSELIKYIAKTKITA